MIPKNTLIRNKIKSKLKKSQDYRKEFIQSMDKGSMNDDHHFRRRMNQMLKKRLTSLLCPFKIDIEEAGDLLELFEERLLMDGYTLNDVIEKKEQLKMRDGDYTMRYTTTENLEEEAIPIMIPYKKAGHVIMDGEHITRVKRRLDDKTY